MPNRFPPGRASFSVMDHTPPYSTAARNTRADRAGSEVRGQVTERWLNKH